MLLSIPLEAVLIVLLKKSWAFRIDVCHIVDCPQPQRLAGHTENRSDGTRMWSFIFLFSESFALVGVC